MSPRLVRILMAVFLLIVGGTYLVMEVIRHIRMRAFDEMERSRELDRMYELEREAVLRKKGVLTNEEIEAIQND